MTDLQIGDLVFGSYLGMIINISRNIYSDDLYYDVEWYIDESITSRVNDLSCYEIMRFRENFLKNYRRLLRKPTSATM